MGEENHPPVRGWEYHAGGDGKWESDPTMVCSREILSTYNKVYIQLDGAAMEDQPECAGTYVPVEGRRIRGRPVSSFDNIVSYDF